MYYYDCNFDDMKKITFIDIEVSESTSKIQDFGAITGNDISIHTKELFKFKNFIVDSKYICGHNIMEHDLWYLRDYIDLKNFVFIDTLFWSPLLFPARPYHRLIKDDKLLADELNNPLNDAMKARDLFYDEVDKFKRLDESLKKIFYSLLGRQKRFSGLFKFLEYTPKIDEANIDKLILQRFRNDICQNADLKTIIELNPVELAYSLAIITASDRYSLTPPWVLKRFPEVQRIMYLLRNKPCITGCSYCNQSLDIHRGLKEYFGFKTFRTYNGEPLQEKAVQAAIDYKSLLAVFPTGGGKSLTFQLPAIMQGENVNGLTVVISPLQSLMKDQVDNLEKKGIKEAVTINGLLNPIERSESIKRVENGTASLLYISPESLRSRTIEYLLLKRNVVRFVVDEAHCLSTWGQDFRVDYLYIGDFIKSLKEKKNLDYDIPVSCFTATAKQQVIEDIVTYFKRKLNLDLEIYKTNTTRKNLKFKVCPQKSEEEKYNKVRDLIDSHKCPTIIYVSRTKKAYNLAQRLIKDGFSAKAYHGKMDKKEKTENQNAFIKGDVDIMVATSAFGMGVDKEDVGLVIHYEISDSLENYIQEAGRAGRSENISAECYVLFNEDDLNKHFILLNQTKINIKEIQQIWKAIKDLTRFRSQISNSALEIARKAGWDDSITDIETRVKTAIAALEESGYVKRGQNAPRVFANSILTKTAQEAIEKINKSYRFNPKQKQDAVRIIKKLFASKKRKQAAGEDAETRIDYISDSLGLVKDEVIQIINLMKEEKILADYKDIQAFIINGKDRQSKRILKTYIEIEEAILKKLESETQIFNIKQLNQELEDEGILKSSTNKIKTVFNFWAVKNWIKQKKENYSNDNIAIKLFQTKEELLKKLERKKNIAAFTIEYLYNKINDNPIEQETGKEYVLIDFSVHELKNAYNKHPFSPFKINIQDVEDTLFYLSRIEALLIEGGFMVIYNKLTIKRLENDNKRRYKIDDYKRLKQFYENKIQQIHIVGEYANKMIRDYREALQFVEDYFQMNYYAFLNKYFKGRQTEIKRNITPRKFKQLFGQLSPAQLKIINDQQSKYIVVAAGPGSGKTRLLVHKLASLFLMEDVKHEQLLMLTFSRAAAIEFKKRLYKLIGNATSFVDIKTFHSYCFDLLGRVGDIEKSDGIIKKAISRIRSGDIEPNKIAKSVLVIDEAQDMNAGEYELITTLMKYNEEMRIIAVGDDDQNIYEFRGSSSKYLSKLISEKSARKYELLENYRSKKNIVDFANHFVSKIKNRLKSNPIHPVQKENGEINIVKHQSNNLIIPLVDHVLKYDLSGTTGILTQTNEEALTITGALVEKGYPAKLIQTNNGFSIYNLREIRSFISFLEYDKMHTIPKDKWNNAKNKLVKKFEHSSKLELCYNIIKDFEATHQKIMYKSDFETFLRESKLEDFSRVSTDTILVSTIHKAKGKEFDNVFVMLNNFIVSEENKRKLYVALTRAKSNLIVHLNSDVLDNIKSENFTYKIDNISYGEPEVIVLEASHKDVWLDSFAFKNNQNHVKNLQSGEEIFYKNGACYNNTGKELFKFSKSFISKIEQMEHNGYHVDRIYIDFIVYWFQDSSSQEIQIVLPNVYFKKNS